MGSAAALAPQDVVFSQYRWGGLWQYLWGSAGTGMCVCGVGGWVGRVWVVVMVVMVGGGGGGAHGSTPPHPTPRAASRAC